MMQMQMLFSAFLVTLALGLANGAVREQFNYPGWSPEPQKGELPLTTGMIVTIKSRELGTFCAMGKEDTIRCDAEEPGKFLILGTDYATNKIMDGGKITLKSQDSYKVCGPGLDADGNAVICDGFISGSKAEFVITGTEARDLTEDDQETIERGRGLTSLYYSIAPAAHPRRECYPAGLYRTAATDAAPDAATDIAPINGFKRDHVLVCDGFQDRHRDTLFEFVEAPYYQEKDTTAASL